MSADRLREAADRLEWPKECYDPWVCCIHFVEDGNALESFPPTPMDRAVAALLRAVANESEVCWCGPEYTERGLSRPGCPAHDVMIASRDAALALANAILGAES